MNLRHLRILWVLAANGYWFVWQIRQLKPVLESANPRVNIWFGGNSSDGAALLIWEPLVLLAGIFLAFAGPKAATWLNCAYFFGIGGFIFYQYSQQMTTLGTSEPTRSISTAAVYIVIGLITLAFGFESKVESKPVDLSQHW